MNDIRKWVSARSPGATVLPFSAAYESRMSALSAEEQAKYVADKQLKVPVSMLPKLIQAGYKALDCVHFFTGNQEVRAWTVRVRLRTHACRNAVLLCAADC
jgi:obg-like ATPase 1